RLGRPLKRAAPPHGEAPDLGQDQQAVVQRSPIAALLGGDRVGATAPLKARIARRLAVLDAAEERLLRPVEPGHHMRPALRADVAVVRPRLCASWQVALWLAPATLTPHLCQAAWRSWRAALSSSRQRRKTTAIACACCGGGLRFSLSVLRTVCSFRP